MNKFFVVVLKNKVIINIIECSTAMLAEITLKETCRDYMIKYQPQRTRQCSYDSPYSIQLFEKKCSDNYED